MLMIKQYKNNIDEQWLGCRVVHFTRVTCKSESDLQVSEEEATLRWEDFFKGNDCGRKRL